MTEAAGGGGRAEVERRLVQRSLQDEEFRQRLLDDPKGTLEQEIGRGLPEGVQVRVVEESADTIYLVLPSASAVGEGGGSLSDEALEAVSGGGPALTSVYGVPTCGGACGNY
jgi:Nitrile hydratase, alpha chain